MLTSMVFGVPHGHLYVAVTVGSITSSMITLMMIVDPDSNFDNISVVNRVTSDLTLLYNTKSNCLRSMNHSWTCLSVGVHRSRLARSMRFNC